LSQEKHDSGGLSTARIETLVDGVFAIVMTLLIFNIKVPELHGTFEEIKSKLGSALQDLWPSYFSYVLSFLVVGIYWVGQHNQFHFIKRSDRWLIWINILFLMSVSVIPFSAALLGAYFDQQLTMIVYGINLIVTGLILYLHWWYVVSHRLVDSKVTPEVVRTATRRILTPPVIYLIAILASFLSTWISVGLYVVAPILYILPSRVDRHWHLGFRSPAFQAEKEPEHSLAPPPSQIVELPKEVVTAETKSE